MERHVVTDEDAVSDREGKPHVLICPRLWLTAGRAQDDEEIAVFISLLDGPDVVSGRQRDTIQPELDRSDAS